ncbi:FAD-dependent oxidoreductase, partial [Dactylosporangium sp. NPDC051485]|uniref:FAD-dependent oxidoreductase n=1 Tax=Dactylosporangium sp. NPDC051485 TaxID=3154846 RepID=UPI003444608D
MRVVVVGAGIVGAAIAYAAARRGAEVTLVDAVGPAAGATGASFGWIGTSGKFPGGAAALRDEVLPHWRRLEAEVPGVEIRWTGSLTWPAPDGPVPGAQLLAADRVAALEPNLRDPSPGALHRPGDGSVDPVAVTGALIDAARGLGARTRFGVPVERVLVRGGRAAGVDKPEGPNGADAVVPAAGNGVGR